MPDEAPVTSAILLFILSSVPIFMRLPSVVVSFNNVVCIASFISVCVYMHTWFLQFVDWFVSGTFWVICSGPTLRFRDRRGWRTNVVHREFLPQDRKSVV